MADDLTTAHPQSFEQFGALLRYLRVRARMAQRDLAIAVGYSEAHISRLEQGQRRPDLDIVRAHFVEALDLEQEPAWAARLIELAGAEPPPRAGTSEPMSAEHPLTPPQPALLSTKLYCPHPRPNTVERTRLLARLHAAFDTPLTLLAAPAGFGKTTLLANWIAATGEQAQAQRKREPASGPTFGWLSLDSGDNDAAVFVRYLIAAFRRISPTVGAGTLALVQAATPVPEATLLTPLLNDLAALDRPAVLVLDDYHVIGEAAVHGLITFLIEQLPPQVHIVIASRSDPPLPLARWRARGLFTEVRAAHLRFQSDETIRFFRETMGLQLDDSAAQALGARTEGWAAGLQLTALALHEQTDPAGFVNAFTGSHRYVLDYLVEEVIERLPAHLYHFLLQTAILEQFDGPLCDAVLGLEVAGGDSYSRLMLQELERLQLFLIPLDSERRWYRYHHLFADVLRERLASGVPQEQIAELYLRAAAAEAFPERAVEYLLRSGAARKAAAAIEAEGERLLAQSRHTTLERWIAALPMEARHERPRLLIYQGIALARRGDVRTSITLLEQGLAGCRDNSDAEGQARALAELAILRMVHGELMSSRDLVEQALSLPIPAGMRIHALPMAIACNSMLGNVTATEQYADELFTLLRSAGNQHLQSAVLVGAHALYPSLLHRLDALEHLCREGLTRHTDPADIAGMGAKVALAYIAWQRGQLDEALHLSDAVFEAWQRTGAYVSIAPLMLTLQGAVAVVRGDLDEGARCFTQALEQSTGAAIYNLAYAGQMYQLARVRWQQGACKALEELHAQFKALKPSPIELHAAMDVLFDALLALSAGDNLRAETLLRPLSVREDRIGTLGVFGSAHTLLAHSALHSTGPAAAAAALAPLLSVCERDKTPGRMLNEGPMIKPLLQAAIDHNTHAAFAARVLAIFASVPAPQA